jgi:hypothetical protein
MLQKHNTVVKTFRFCLTGLRRLNSLNSEKAGLPHFRSPWLLPWKRWILVSGFGLVLGACAVMEQVTVEEAKKEVSERAQQRWDLLMKGQVEKAYEYYSPASRSTLTLEAFRKRSGVGRWWRSLQVHQVDCGADTCQVTMILEYDLFEIKGLKASIEETWVNDAGTWWLVAGK